jgi:6-phosphogluconolactonase
MTAAQLRLTVLSLGVLLVAGCGGSHPIATNPTPACVPSSTPEFAYALTGLEVSMYTVNSCTGALIPTNPATVATGLTSSQDPAEQMVADPLGRFAYVANLVSNAADEATISMYTINPTTGVLTPTSPATIHTGFLPQGIGIDPAGKFVYTANSDDNSISMFTINPTTGVLTPTKPATVAAGWSPLSMTVHPSGKFAYAANQVDNTVSMYTIDSATGFLTPTKPVTAPTGISPFDVVIDPSGKFAYVPNAYSSDNTVSQYTIDPVSGVLTPNTPASVSAGNQPTSVAIDPSSKFAYVVNRIDNSVSMFKIDAATGNLTPNGTIATGSQPFRLTFDPSGKFLYVANEDSAPSIYSLKSDGTLTAAATATSPTGSLSIAFAAVKH